MLTTIREKSQGAFAWGILLIIGVPFALWGINNYTDNAKESPVASVGDKDFYQRDVNKAYEQYSQAMRGLGVDEQALKAQALQKLIKDEVLLQYVQSRGLTVNDENVREFVKGLEYFQTDGHFDDNKYKSLLASQHMSSTEFVSRVKKAMVMEQFQHSIVDSSFASQYDVESFFKIQNQMRDVDYLTVSLPTAFEPPKDEDIAAYYQQHQNAYQTPEQLSVEYVELSLADMAKKVAVTDEKLKAFYEEQKDQYTTPERRKISHILFLVNDKTTDQAALEKAKNAKQELLAGKDFAQLASTLSDDKATAKTGGDLGLFTTGVMEKSFEAAVTALKMGELSEPIKSSFGYHLIKVTELAPAQIKPFDSVKDEVTKAFQKSQAETSFYEAGEKLTETSYQNPDSLQAVSDTLGLTIKKSALFTKERGEGIAADDKIRSAGFTDEVLHGNNSTPIEVGSDVLVVLRMLEHKPAATQELELVKKDIAAILANDKAKQLAIESAKQIKNELLAGESLQAVAAKHKLAIKNLTGLTRRKTDLPPTLIEAIFKAPKPIANKPSIFIAPQPSGEQIVVSLTKVSEGVMSEDDKKQLELAKKNIGNAFGETEFNAVLNSLQSDADITMGEVAVPAAE